MGKADVEVGVGVDAVAGADANLQRALGGVSWVHRVQAIGRARAPRRGLHSSVTRVDNVGGLIERRWGRRRAGARELDLTVLDRLDQAELGS